jgi:hypothetical protein
MAKLISNTFSSYELTARERLAGSILSTDQYNLLQNELSMVADNIIALDYDPAHPLKFVQNEAHLKGQLSILRFMLLRSDESKEQLKNLPSL